MEEPSYENILQSKIDHYGETKASYQFTAEEYAKQYHEYMVNKLYFKKKTDFTKQEGDLYVYFTEEKTEHTLVYRHKTKTMGHYTRDRKHE